MKKKDLISKWLDNNLIDEELEAFEKSDVFRSYQKISQAAKQYGAPDFDLDSNYQKVLASKAQSSKMNSGWIRYAVGIAAALLISMVAYNVYPTQQNVAYMALNMERTILSLPDASEVTLNAGSSLTYDDKDWSNNRNLTLNGEGYFKVAKGSKFTVNTDQGNVSVLGTQFNVKSRNQYFEVICFEGLVQVDINGKSFKLPAGESLTVLDGQITKELTALTEPTWVLSKSTFKSVPLSHILSEMERQYDLTILKNDIDVDLIFTGGFTHKNLETALQAIAIPLNLSYEINEDVVTLKNE